MSLKRRNIKRVLLACLMLMLSACAMSPSPYRYKVTLPVLEVAPKTSPCELKNQAGVVVIKGTCVTVLESDYQMLIVELKAACLGTGGTPKECRTEE